MVLFNIWHTDSDVEACIDSRFVDLIEFAHHRTNFSQADTIGVHNPCVVSVHITIWRGVAVTTHSF